jgi:23S rRNA-/tRNA-specific pseudouridylate synthase
MDPSALPPSATLPEIAYEDAHCAIVVKPEGVPTVGDAEWTAESALPYVLEPAVGVEGALPRPRPTHRLDKPTGGLLLCAKTRLAQETLGAAFEARRVIKRYRALLYVDARDDERRRRAASEKKGAGDAGEDACGVIGGAALLGNPEQSTRRDVGGVVSAALGGRAASTRWRRVRFERGTRDSRAGLALVDMWPKTGRTHQLRRHAAETLLAPILGDGRYAKREHRAGALVSTTDSFSTKTKTRGGGDDAEGAGEEGGEEGEGEEGGGEGGEGLFLFAAELSLPLSAMPWLGGGDALGEGGEGVGKTLEGGAPRFRGSATRRREGRRHRGGGGGDGDARGGDVAQGACERAGEVRRQARAREASARTRRGGGERARSDERFGIQKRRWIFHSHPE